ncbi:hypothetical protein OG21DRAFT_1509448 [Imleria badia]|nr:hypothetical protein OG21DRAFT_1509448 [Imleria badia]
MVEAPYQYVRKRMVRFVRPACDQAGNVSVLFLANANPSMVSNHIPLMEDPDRSKYQKALKQTSSTAFLGSVETTSSLLLPSRLRWSRTLGIWKRAQADIDAIVGTDRLPEFDDRSSLPYVCRRNPARNVEMAATCSSRRSTCHHNQ